MVEFLINGELIINSIFFISLLFITTIILILFKKKYEIIMENYKILFYSFISTLLTFFANYGVKNLLFGFWYFAFLYLIFWLSLGFLLNNHKKEKNISQILDYIMIPLFLSIILSFFIMNIIFSIYLYISSDINFIDSFILVLGGFALLIDF